MEDIMNKYVKRTITILILLLIAGGLVYYSYVKNQFDIPAEYDICHVLYMKKHVTNSTK